MNADQNEPDSIEEPLDPAFEKVRQKMVRLLAVSIGVMFIGVLAVLAAVIWRINDTVAQRTFSISVPKDAVVQQMSIEEGRIGLLVSLADGTRELIVYDSGDGTVLLRSPLRDDLPLQGAVPE